MNLRKKKKTRVIRTPSWLLITKCQWYYSSTSAWIFSASSIFRKRRCAVLRAIVAALNVITTRNDMMRPWRVCNFINCTVHIETCKTFNRLKSSIIWRNGEHSRVYSVNKSTLAEIRVLCLNKQLSGAVYRVCRERFTRSRWVYILIRRILFEHTLYDLQNTHQTIMRKYGQWSSSG